MKTKNLLTRISFGALFAAAALLPAALTSCSSESDPTPTPEPEPIPEGMARINMSFASPYGGVTRVDDPIITEDERTISSLWVYFYSVDDATTPKYAFSIKDNYASSTSGETLNNSISTVSADMTSPTDVITGMNIQQGKYKIYVLANFDGLKDDIKPSATTLTTTAKIAESAVSGASITQTSGVFTKTKLPMACNYTELDVKEVANGVSYSDGIVDIKSGQVDIVAPLTILCSKVRFSFFFDGTEDTGSSYPYTSCALNGAQNVSNINTVTSVFGTVAANNQSKASAVQPMALTKYIYPDDAADWLDNTKTTYLADLTSTTDNTTKFVWQGTMYITENLVKDDKTKLTFKTTLGKAGAATDDKDFEINLPTKTTSSTADKDVLKRGNYYDVIAHLTGYGFKLYVKVNNWVDEDEDSFVF